MTWWDTYIRTQKGASGHPPAGASALDRVLIEIVSAIEAGGTPTVDLVAIFRVERQPVLASAFQRFAASPDLRLEVLGLRALLSMATHLQ